MNDIQLLENFKLSEFTASESARRRKINNDAPELVIENLHSLRHHVVYYMKKNWFCGFLLVLDRKFEKITIILKKNKKKDTSCWKSQYICRNKTFIQISNMNLFSANKWWWRLLMTWQLWDAPLCAERSTYIGLAGHGCLVSPFFFEYNI